MQISFAFIKAATSVLLSMQIVAAETYYIDGEAGNDQRNGKSIGTAWKTLYRVNSTSVRCGDTVLLKRGSVWESSADIANSCSADFPVVFGAYGIGRKRPVIEGGGVLPFNVRIRSGSAVTIRDLELRGAALMPISLLNDGITLSNVSVSDATLRLLRVVNISSQKRWHGAWLPGIYTDPESVIARFRNLTGSAPAVVNVYVPWASKAQTEVFDARLMDSIVDSGATPMVSWEPMNWTNADRSDRAFSLDKILSGDWDVYIQTWAQSAAKWKKPFLLRFAHEMNGDWSPWSVGDGRNGNTPAKYVAVWNRIHELFRKAGATNAKFVWCPDGAANLSLLPGLYPGDNTVDYVAFDQYNWGGKAWKDPYELLAPCYSIITSLTQKPLFLAETGVPEEGGVKADYETRLFGYTIPVLLPRISGVCWFNEAKERDWRVETSAASLFAYSDAMRNQAWTFRLTLGAVP